MDFLVVEGNYNNINKVEPGGLNKIIVRDLKTLRGVINRCIKWYPFKEYTIFTFTNFYDDNTFSKVYQGSR